MVMTAVSRGDQLLKAPANPGEAVAALQEEAVRPVNAQGDFLAAKTIVAKPAWKSRMKRGASADEFGAVAAFLCSAPAAYV
ncbi:hypothetical protein AB0D71_44030, partial [Streptomyces avermitilis]|uniref:hypothetical protein n=1 Tax=Streptomyces avermitilis TaxID=33903 RepID=UPI0033EB4A95